MVAGIFVASGLSIAAPAEKKLAVVRASVHQIEDGPPLATGDHFIPGETVYFSCQVEGYQKSDMDEVSLTYQVEARDARGILLQAAASGKVQAAVSVEDRGWMPKIRETIVTPPLADSGEYQILVKVRDELAGTDAQARATFLVHGHEVAPSDKLVVRNFRFLRSEEDKEPLQVAAYRPGDTVWARFDMTGYKLGDKNEFDVEYGLKVLRPDGSVTYSQPQAAAQKDQTFYPQRYAPGILSLSLPKDLKRGEYTVVLAVRDNLGNQGYETREKFAVE